MPKLPRYSYSIEGRPVHPHIKLTDEYFPRLLSTRIVDDDGAEYFGAFLGRSSARILIDLLNTTFRLRTCTIPVDGSFDVPCTQYYAKRCLGPCVESLCGRDRYLEIVELSRLFLRNDRQNFELAITAKLEAAAENLEFEAAASYRDILTKIRRFWNEPRRQVWIDDAVDTYVVERDADILRIYVLTTRRLRTLGSLVFAFQVFDETDIREVLADIIAQVYPVTVPREIRIPFDFDGRQKLARDLRYRSGRWTKIVVEGQTPKRAAALKALARTKLDVELEKLKPYVSPERIQRQLVKLFGLREMPSRLIAFDAAHISGRFASAGMSVWVSGKLISEDYRVALSDQPNEIATLREFAKHQLSQAGVELPGLVLVDGGKGHVNAVRKALDSIGLGQLPVVGAVKPKGKHGDISYFIKPDGDRADLDPDLPAVRVLKVLRDEAHDLANAAHGNSRDMAHHYQLAGMLPSLNEKERQVLFEKIGSIRRIVESDTSLIADVIGVERAAVAANDVQTNSLGSNTQLLPPVVPLRYDDPNGEAFDLRPIKAHTIVDGVVSGKTR